MKRHQHRLDHLQSSIVADELQTDTVGGRNDQFDHHAERVRTFRNYWREVLNDSDDFQVLRDGMLGFTRNGDTLIVRIVFPRAKTKWEFQMWVTREEVEKFARHCKAVTRSVRSHNIPDDIGELHE